jgi:beta-N-acetylhexosaminidase
VLDVSVHELYHFRHIERTFSDDPKEVAVMGSAVVKGLQKEGVIACTKHFPGMGQTSADSHIVCPVIDISLESLEQIDLVPYYKAIKSGIETIMTNHGTCNVSESYIYFVALYPALDKERCATLSPIIMTDLLRNKLGFKVLIFCTVLMSIKGVLLTDDLGMGGVLEKNSIEEVVVNALLAVRTIRCIED